MIDKVMVYGPFGHFRKLKREDMLAIIHRRSL